MSRPGSQTADTLCPAAFPIWMAGMNIMIIPTQNPRKQMNIPSIQSGVTLSLAIDKDIARGSGTSSGAMTKRQAQRNRMP